MTTFGKVAVGIIVIVLIFLGWLVLRQTSNSTSPPQTTATTTVATTTEPSIIDDQTYTDSKLSFSIMYPSIATSSPINYSGYLPLTQTPLTSFVLPSSMFAGTNLAEAGVYVGASSSPEAITSCKSASGLQGETTEGTQTINGADFSVYTASDAGAGNFYDSKIYRRIENGWCVEVVEMLHSTNIGNYTPGTVTAFDQAYYQHILENIVHTYRSIPTGM